MIKEDVYEKEVREEAVIDRLVLAASSAYQHLSDEGYSVSRIKTWFQATAWDYLDWYAEMEEKYNTIEGEGLKPSPENLNSIGGTDICKNS